MAKYATTSVETGVGVWLIVLLVMGCTSICVRIVKIINITECSAFEFVLKKFLKDFFSKKSEIANLRLTHFQLFYKKTNLSSFR